jgi:hypothetical protein
MYVSPSPSLLAFRLCTDSASTRFSCPLLSSALSESRFARKSRLVRALFVSVYGNYQCGVKSFYISGSLPVLDASSPSPLGRRRRISRGFPPIPLLLTFRRLPVAPSCCWGRLRGSVILNGSVGFLPLFSRPPTIEFWDPSTVHPRMFSLPAPFCHIMTSVHPPPQRKDDAVVIVGA